MQEPAKRIVIVGGGPGGYVAALRAAQLGADVTVVEKDLLGGTCLNRGCIPTKTLIASAQALASARQGDEYGFRLSGEVVPDWMAMQARKDRVVARLRDGIHLLFKKGGVKLVTGCGSLVRPNLVRVQAEDGVREVEADAVILATGSEPARPPFLDFSEACVVDSTRLLESTTVPASLLVLGGGPIGCEFATLFAELGAKVTLVELLPHVLPQEDVRLARQFQSLLRKRGIEVRVGARIDRVLRYDPDQVTVLLDAGDNLRAEKILVAVGRSPNTSALGLELLGVACDKRGYILVNERMETSVPGLYAVGDVTGGPLLAHVATHEGEVAAENCLGAGRERNLRVVPLCVYAAPEIARVGLTEAEARDAGFSPITGTFRFGALGKALALGEEQGYVQVVADEQSDILLGAAMMGPHVTDVIHEVAVALEAGFTARRLGDVIHAHPTIAEAVMEAARDVHGESVHVAG